MEQRLLGTMERAHHFELTRDGALVLHASDGRTITARRP
jgi:hypothetical protein